VVNLNHAHKRQYSSVILLLRCRVKINYHWLHIKTWKCHHQVAYLRQKAISSF